LYLVELVMEREHRDLGRCLGGQHCSSHVDQLQHRHDITDNLLTDFSIYNYIYVICGYVQQTETG